MPQGALILRPDGRIAFGSTHFCDLVGVRCEKVAGMSFFDFVFPEDVDGGRDLFKATKVPRAEPFRFRFRRLDGTEVWTSIEAAFVKAEGGRICAVKFTISLENSNRRSSEPQGGLVF